MVRSMTAAKSLTVEERRARAHRLMEEALVLLDDTGDALPAIHLDHAICALGQRPASVADRAPDVARHGPDHVDEP
jgi:hypothetical protein